MIERGGQHRRSIRLLGADYTEAGGYFVTICTDERRNIFGQVIEGRVLLTPLGEICSQCLQGIPEHFAHVKVAQFVVMPNHLHAILILDVGARYIVPGDRGTRTPEQFRKPVTGSVPTIVRTFKAAVTRRTARELKWPGDIWQRNYYERVLRDGKEYAQASRYIAENPLRWGWDSENLQRQRTEGLRDLAG
jgi:REP-associated tyrosine transposase